ncbi:MAG: RIP metalloprotease RseP [Clostridiales bacterium]|nr:RIP metalloprotease RseP [Candidatus Crickella merdequi]
MITAVLFVVMLLVLVIPHEFGHMIVAKLCGVQVNEFSVGMGPLIFQKQKGETMYSVRLLPLGGFCAMEGEDEESENPRAFNNKKPSQKIAVLLAGVMMNVLLALIIVFGVLTSTGVPTTTLSEVQKGSPAYEAGLKEGDKIIAIDGNETESWAEVVAAITEYHEGDTLEISTIRNGRNQVRFVKPEYNNESERYTIGIIAGVTKNPVKVISYSVQYTKNLNSSVIMSFKMLLTGKLSRNDVSGPVGMVKIVDQTRSYGITSYLLLVALISLNLALFNILPFPALDGGRILFVIIRMVTGKAISDELEGTIHAVGMLLLLGFFIFITCNDVINLF